MSDPDVIWSYAKFDGARIFHKKPNIPDMPTEYRRADLPSTDAEVMAHPKVKALVEASGRLLHSVCSDTGFAACVRQDSGLAYPWEPMDEAEAELRAAIAAIQEAKS